MIAGFLSVGHREHYLQLHAARILILVKAAGQPDAVNGRKVIRGTVKLAKLDFLLRCPPYLREAVRIRDPDTASTWDDPDHVPMGKYKMGPFEPELYDVMSYLASRRFINIRRGDNSERIFELTNEGEEFVELELLPELKYAHVLEVAKLVGKFFGGLSGNELKTFLYANFSEIADTPLYKKIPLPVKKEP